METKNTFTDDQLREIALRFAVSSDGVKPDDVLPLAQSFYEFLTTASPTVARAA